MMTLCDCCVSENQYVRSHLNWNPGAVPITDWEAYAQGCLDFWKAAGDPIDMTVERLAEILRELYDTPQQ